MAYAPVSTIDQGGEGGPDAVDASPEDGKTRPASLAAGPFQERLAADTFLRQATPSEASEMAPAPGRAGDRRGPSSKIGLDISLDISLEQDRTGWGPYK